MEKKKEQELFKKAAIVYKSIIRGSMDSFVMLDMHGTFLDVNDAYCQLIGHRRSELLKMNIADVEIPKIPESITKQLPKIKKALGFL